MAKDILIKPIISEKSETLSENLSQYTFVVNKKANKVEIGKAIEDMYSVNVTSVNTLVMPSKNKTRNTRTGVRKGRISTFKKAIVTLNEGESINYFGDV